MDSGNGSRLGVILPDNDSGNVQEDGYLDQPGKDKGTGMHSWINLGDVDQISVQAQG